jgi:hypothetical protein
MKAKHRRILHCLALTLCAMSARAAIEVTFDPTDSDIAAGQYDFVLSGVPTSPAPTYNSVFDIYDWAAPGIGNTLNPIQSDSSPSGWNLPSNDSNNARWDFENTSGAVNGLFVVTASPNLQGTLSWTLEVPGITQDNASGTVAVAIPEPQTYATWAAFALGFLAIAPRWKKSPRLHLC